MKSRWGVSSSAGKAEPCQSPPRRRLQELCSATLGGPHCYISAPQPSCGQKLPPASRHASDNSSSALAHPPAAAEKPMDSNLKVHPNGMSKSLEAVETSTGLAWVTGSSHQPWLQVTGELVPCLCRLMQPRRSRAPAAWLGWHVSRAESPQQHGRCFSLSFSAPSRVAAASPCLRYRASSQAPWVSPATPKSRQTCTGRRVRWSPDRANPPEPPSGALRS